MRVGTIYRSATMSLFASPLLPSNGLSPRQPRSHVKVTLHSSVRYLTSTRQSAHHGAGCPVLRSLPEKVKRPWWQELDFSRDPFVVQSEVLQGNELALCNYLLANQLFVGSMDTAKEVLVKQGEVFDFDAPPHMLYLLGSESVGTSPCEKHMFLRKLLSPSFSSEEVDRYLPTIQALCERYCDKWSLIKENKNWYQEIKLATFETICSVVGGFDFSPEKLDYLSGLFATFFKGIAFPITIDVPFTPFGKAMDARRKIATELTQQVVEYRARSANGQQGKRLSMLSRLLEATDEEGNKLTEQQLMDNFISILLGGHDTTAASLSIAFYLLDQNPRSWDELRAEQLRLVAKFGPQITPECLKEMAYTEAVLRETWRIQPVVPLVARKPTQDVQVGEYLIPAGQPTMVALNYVLRTDPRWQGATGDLSPDKFYPERFLSEEGKAQGSQIPFGAGRHTCLGMALALAEAKTFLAVVARGYKYRLAPGVSWTVFPFPVVKADCTFERSAGQAP